MNETVELYGFGSFFNRDEMDASDIDLLLIHANTEPSSIAFAIQCKATLISKIAKADIVMLSRPEERELDFLVRSNAQFLTSLNASLVEAQLSTLIGSLPSLMRFQTGYISDEPPA